MPKAEPPKYIDDLIDDAAARRGLKPDARLPGGPMARYVERRFTSAELAAHEDNIVVAEDAPHLFELVRAFEVKGIAGGRFTAPTVDDLAPCLQRFLRERLPVFEWEVPDLYLGPLWKYLILHDHVLGPPDATTGQPMGLEFWGQVLRIGQFSVAWADPMSDWWDSWRAYQWKAAGRHVELARPVEVEMVAATWANFRSTNANMPFYM
jgi:hypothetical protein